MHSYHSLGRVLRDAGFRFPPLIESIPGRWRNGCERERLPNRMPILFLQPGAVTPVVNLEDELAAMEKVMPGWCQFLTPVVPALCADFS